MNPIRITLRSLVAVVLLFLAACQQTPLPQATPELGAELSTQAVTPGTVVGWGYNNAGQLNIPAGLNDVIAIAAGSLHSLALKGDGTVVAWGESSSGQLNIPAGLNDVIAIAVGGYHSLALKGDGTVVGWGYNEYGQVSIPAGLNDVIAIAAGDFHSLALKNDGTVVGWGNNQFGQVSIPAGLNDVTAIAAGSLHSLALKGDGTVVAWGESSSGQVNIPVGLNDITAIAAGSFHSLALKGDGTVVAWGESSSGQLNIPAGLNDVVAIAAGEFHSLALKGDGTVVGWGWNDFGQVSIPAGLNNVTAIAGGGRQHSLALVASDSTPPVLTPSVTGTLGSNDWYTSDVSVSWTVTDDESAISNQTGCENTSVTTDTAGVTFTCGATSAGGVSSQSVTIKRDATAPSLTPVVSPNPVMLKGTATATAGASDSLSGLASQTCGSVDTSSVGGKSVSCTATDNAGNSASANASYQVIYNFTGFFSPVNNLPTLNQVKAGQAIPVKFSLGGNQGLNILASGSPSSQTITCGSGLAIDDIEVTVTAGGSSLSYDVATNTYSYVWKTNKAWANTCRQLIVTLADGTQHSAHFKFK
jgi:hypothetical protein